MGVEPFLQSFITAVARSGPILDLGCGTGLHAHTLSLAGFRVCAVDTDLDALTTAQSLYPRVGSGQVTYCAGNAAALPFADASFAAILCIDVLHWSADAAAFEAIWAEALRVLRPGGEFLVKLRLREFSSIGVTSWFLAEEAKLMEMAAREGMEWVEPMTHDQDSAVLRLKKP